MLRPHHGGLMLSEVEPSRLGEEVRRGHGPRPDRQPVHVRGAREVTAPFDPSLLVLVRERVTKVDPGDYGFMVANGATAVPVER